MNHVLSLEAPDTLNSCILRVIDTSIYSPLIPVVCPRLDITLPGFTSSIQLNVTQGFSLNLTACDVGVQTTNCGVSYANFSDGVYILKYSVSPNNIVYVEYNHLRITHALKMYMKIMCSLDVNGCDPSKEVKQKIIEARMYRDMLDAAKAKVEVCHSPKKGMEIYSYACRQLEKMSCGICT